MFEPIIFEHLNTGVINAMCQQYYQDKMVQIDSKKPVSTNYLLTQKAPETSSQAFYEDQKGAKIDYTYISGPESHLLRRKAILQQHPEIAKLLVPSKPYSMILAVLLVSLNLSLAYFIKDSSWSVLLLVVYVLGGTIGHTCHILVHDFTHLIGHKSPLVNKAFAILCNLGQAVPSAISFGIYHADHHNFFSEEIKDPDLPTGWQVKYCTGKWSKFFYFMLMTPIYALRPLFCAPKKLTTPEIINIVVVLCNNLLVFKFWGFKAFAYLFLTSYFSIGGHPAAIHVIAEHYQFAKGLETYDYLGIWNVLNLNVGYHIEHHDFPTCPWYNLPALRAAAPEWYEYLPHHTSYIKLLKKFILDDNFNLYHRILRIPQTKNQ